MKKIIVTLLLFSPFMAVAQERESIDFRKNSVKLNLFALPLKTVSLQYERALNENFSAALGFRIQPKGDLPFQSVMESMMDTESPKPGEPDDPAVSFVKEAQMSNWAITPEVRFYMGRKPSNGFYLAPYMRIGGYGLEWDYKFDLDDGTPRPVALKGKVNTFSGGLMMGAQWHLGKRILLDWWILGASFGSNKVSLDAKTDLSDLTAAEQARLEKDISSIGFSGKKTTVDVSDSGITASNSFSLPGLRAGLCIGYTF